MIQLDNISLSYGSRELFKNLYWHVKDGKRIGLFGPNGVGKTTLLNVMAGAAHPDSGSILVPPGKRVGYLPQEVEDVGSRLTVLEEALSTFREIGALEREMESVKESLGHLSDKGSAEYEKALHRLDAIQTELNTRDSHTVRYRAEKLLMGLGFEPEDLERPLDTFSGGWRMRVALAKLLLVNPDLLLLDEPTNHLDIESIDWLEWYLKDFPGTVILVSHDQYFLDRMVDTIAELSMGNITEYAGNYSSYIEERKARIALHRSAYENQQRKIKDTERFIERFRYKNTKAKQVQSRVKGLEKLERIQPPPGDADAIHFKFPDPGRSGKVVLELSSFSKSYPNDEGGMIPVFENAGPLTISRGDKIALIGKNGAGKSTLARMLLGTEPFEGERKEGHNVEVTFFAQHQAESLNPRNTILEELSSEAGARSEVEIRTLLGAFLFTDTDVFKKISVLSGGEKSRVALAKTLLSPKNFMILDEPTNHLDIQSRNVLVDALNHYNGTFVVVSHDRLFLDRISNKVWYAEKGRVVTYPGNYSEFRYHQSLRERGEELAPVAGNGRPLALQTDTGNGPAEVKPALSKREEAERRNRLYRELAEKGIENMENWEELSSGQLRTALKDLEGKIHSSEEKKSGLEDYLADPENFRNSKRSEEVTREYGLVNDDLRKLYERWEAVSAHLEGRAPGE